MRWPWIRRVCLWGASLLALAMPLAARAQMESREGIALQNQLYQLRQELQVMRSDIGRIGNGSSSGGGGGDIAAQLLSRVQAMEEQVRQLRGRIDETQNLVNRQHADLAKRIDDLTFQLNLPGRTAAAPPIAAPSMPAPPPVREVPPIREASPRPPPELVRPNEPTPPRIDPAQRMATPAPLPLIIPPPPPAPPKSFTFNQIPEPMRETPQPPATTPPARIEPTPPARVEPIPPVVNRPPDPAPKPPPRAVETIPPPAPLAAPETPPGEVGMTPLAPGEKRTPERALQEGHAALARRDYASAEKSAREVMGNRASPRAYDGQYLLAQSLAGQKQFAQAAIAFDDAYNRSHKGRYAQEALLGLAGALTAINEKRAACDTLGRLRVEFPQVRADLKDSITKTNERAGCGR